MHDVLKVHVVDCKHDLLDKFRCLSLIKISFVCNNVVVELSALDNL